jgi:riboflavin kinase/FMN adenylyltransferase
MQVIELSYPLQLPVSHFPETMQVLAIGYFDGVHLGHQDVIRKALAIGGRERLPVSIMTFNPHPREVLGDSQYAKCLTPFQEKMNILREMGVHYAYVVRFDDRFARLSPEDFVSRMLKNMQIHTVVVGFDFTFGHRGRGTVETLKQLVGFARVEVVAPFHLDGEKISSTLIREQLQLGRPEKARSLLGRCYSIQGKVVSGEGRGRTLGFPTANIEVTDPYVIPCSGVYAVRLTLDGNHRYGVMNIGVKPTFSGQFAAPVLEAHLFDFHEHIYGRQIGVEFLAYLRQEKKFSSVQELVEQIRADAERARQVIDKHKESEYER